MTQKVSQAALQKNPAPSFRFSQVTWRMDTTSNFWQKIFTYAHVVQLTHVRENVWEEEDESEKEKESTLRKTKIFCILSKKRLSEREFATCLHPDKE